jgi:hypothetical protein
MNGDLDPLAHSAEAEGSLLFRLWSCQSMPRANLWAAVGQMGYDQYARSGDVGAVPAADGVLGYADGPPSMGISRAEWRREATPAPAAAGSVRGTTARASV